MNLELTETSKAKLLELLWADLRLDDEHPRLRRQTGWGSKTPAGLIACIQRIMDENQLELANAQEQGKLGTYPLNPLGGLE